MNLVALLGPVPPWYERGERILPAAPLLRAKNVGTVLAPGQALRNLLLSNTAGFS